jgi:hypothetical protein
MIHRQGRRSRRGFQVHDPARHQGAPRRQLDDVRDDRDRWRVMAEASQRLLAPPRRVPWWRRLAG